MRKNNIFGYVISFISTMLILGLGKEVSAISIANYAPPTVQSQEDTNQQKLLAQFESFKQIEESDSDDDIKPTPVSGGGFSSFNFDFVNSPQFYQLLFVQLKVVIGQPTPLFILFRNLRI